MGTMFTPLAVKAYDPAGVLVTVTDTTEIRAPSGVLKILQADNVVSVEIHYDDGSSNEYRLKEGS